MGWPWADWRSKGTRPDPGNHAEDSMRQRPALILGIAITLLTLALYWRVQGHGFLHYDDYQYVVDNPHVRHGLTRQGVLWALTSGYASNWHPLTWLSHMLDCELYGLNPQGHHLNNLLLHIANALLLFRLLLRMTGALWRSAFVAALFALHPLHVESVAWVAERKDVLSTLFWMLTLGAYLRYRERPTGTRYLATLFLFALGLAAKPMLVTLPFVLLLLDCWPLGRMPSPRSLLPLVREKAPFFVLAALSSVITFWVQSHWGAVVLSIPLKERLANALVSYVGYGAKMLWPVNLACFYPHPLDGLPLWQAAGALLLLAGVTVAVVRAGRRLPYLAVGWLWYLGTLVPVIGLVQVGAQAMADRYTYVPLIGLFVMLSWGAGSLAAKGPLPKIATAALSAALLAALLPLTWSQISHWKDSETLFAHALEVTDRNLLAHNNLGNALARQGRLEEAEFHLVEALRLRPDYAAAQNNLGILRLRQGRFEEAAGHFANLDDRPAVLHHGIHGHGDVAFWGRIFEAERASS